ncbi:hypothetical protein WEI85_07660 [Actinomycetes bacterium KLBMP 9797]
MDEQDFLGAAATHDAHATAAAIGGRATSDQHEFRDWLDEAAARRAMREADTRTAEQIADEIGHLHQRSCDAAWYGTLDQSARAGLELLQALQHPSVGRLYVHAAEVRVGDHVRVRGFDADGEPEGATGVVNQIHYTEQVVDLYGFGDYDTHYGFAFTVMPVVRADWAAEAEEIWVRETGSPEVLRLPKPVDRGRQQWLDEPDEPTPGRGPASVAGLSFGANAGTPVDQSDVVPQPGERPRHGWRRGR